MNYFIYLFFYYVLAMKIVLDADLTENKQTNEVLCNALAKR